MEQLSIEDRFSYHAPRKDQVETYDSLRGTFKNMAYTICEMTPASREQSLALTKLEEAMFFANAAVARHG